MIEKRNTNEFSTRIKDAGQLPLCKFVNEKQKGLAQYHNRLAVALSHLKGKRSRKNLFQFKLPLRLKTLF